MSNLSLLYTELVAPLCGHTFGVAPCTATGEHCFNTPATCADVPNYDTEGEQVLRWVESCGYEPVDIPAVPSLTGVTISAQRISPGEHLGKRERATASFDNTPTNGDGLDPYIAERDYNHYKQGSYWGRFNAIYPNIQGYEFRIVRGFVGQTREEMETAYYVAEEGTLTGDSSGYKISARDVLTFVEGNKSLCPLPSDGVLAEDMGLDLTPFDLVDGSADGYPEGVELEGSIGDEYLRFTRSGNTITPVKRLLYGSALEEHEAGDTLQLAAVIEGTASEILTQLLGYTDTPTEYYDIDAWDAECATHDPRTYVGRIAEPTEVHKLISELMIDLALDIHSDIVNRKIVMRFIRNRIKTFDLTDDVLDGLSPGSSPDKRISAFYIRYARKNPLEKMDEPQNYSARLLYVNGDANIALQRNAPAIRSHYSRWIQGSQRQAASDTGLIMTGRYATAPRELKAIIPEQFAPALGDVGSVTTRVFEDAHGLPDTWTAQVVQLQKGRGNCSIVLEEYAANNIPIDDTRIVQIYQDMMNINLRELYESAWGAGEIPENAEIIFDVEPNVVIGSNTGYAVLMGEWPEIAADGVTVEIRRMFGVGYGGAGSMPGFAGGAGGPAFYTRYPVTLTDCEFGGGGGGGAGLFTTGDLRGGGGAGKRPGDGYEMGTLLTGGLGNGLAGAGGDLGQPGADRNLPGGEPGAAVDGISYVTNNGSTFHGPTIN